MATLLACIAFLPAPLVCHEPTAAPPPDTADDTGMKEENAKADPPPPEPPVWPVEVHDPDRWLRVELIRNGSDGGWATGSFDPKRNKLDLHTHEVRAFSIDTDRVPINWERIVILGIDGSNSELRRRDFQVYHFELTEHGRWVVAKP